MSPPTSSVVAGGELLLERNTLVTRFGASDPTDPVLCSLHALVLRRGPFEDDGIGWLEDVMDWLGSPRGRVAARTDGEPELVARTRVLVEALEEIPSFRAALSAVVQGLVGSSASTSLFTSTGLPTRPNFWGELLDRLMMKVLPDPPVEHQLSRVMGRLFARRRVAEAVATLPEALWGRLAQALRFDDELVARGLRPGLREAALILGARLAAQGTADDVVLLFEERGRPSGEGPGLSPFLCLVEDVQALLAGTRELTAIGHRLEECWSQVQRAREGLERRGISVDLVFRIELLETLLRRLGLVLGALCRGAQGEGRLLAAELIVGTADDRSLRAVWEAGTRLLARRMVERAGTSGESYVTRTRAEQRAMLHAAAGGGALTSAIVLLKFFVAHAGLPPLFNALGIGLNYAWGFLLMQVLHFSLATKQPSMTAATIAGAVEAGQEQQAEVERPGFAHGAERLDLTPVVDLVARASRTQFTALLGNVVMVVPLVVLLDLGFVLFTGHHAIDAKTAAAVVTAHHPWRSGTFIFAAATGVWLWAASLLAGGAENWFIVRELPGALATSRTLRRLLGPWRAQRVADVARAQVNGVGGNLGLGLLLGFMPMFFSLFGIPLEVRHVTFVTGQLTFAALEQGPSSLARPEVLVSLLSVPMVGMVNFAASFLMALVVALLARGLGLRWLLRLARAVWQRLAHSPKEFFLAPPDPAPPPQDGASGSPP